jgi:hypothetical protein
VFILWITLLYKHYCPYDIIKVLKISRNYSAMGGIELLINPDVKSGLRPKASELLSKRIFL